MTLRTLFLLALLGSTQTVWAQPAAGELADRRARLASGHTDGVILLFARFEEKAMEQPMWIQNPSFQYFAGLANGPGAILAIDAARGQSILFVPPAPSSFGIPIQALNLANDAGLADRTGIDQVRSWDEFGEYLQGRVSDGAPLYLDEPRRPHPAGAPEGFAAVTGFHNLWRQALEAYAPDAEFRSAAESIRSIRWVKSPSEVAELRTNATASAAGLRAGMQAIGSGKTQRQIEAAVVAGCLNAGAEGPSFWPWTMSGPNSHINSLVRSFFDYSHLNREMERGELVRVDIGCAGGGYGGDVGRTVPVSGSFSDEQAVVWDLLVRGYQAGIRSMRPGAELDAIRQASRDAILASSDSDLARAMADDDGVNWHIHGVGIESGESPGGALQEGVVLAYEPMFVHGDHAYYLEDMILITGDGAEVLTTGLPYTSAEMTAFLASDDR